ncbi:MAG: HTH-type transcriptional repressor AseR [candidate division WS2 bacterium]|nr:HTH-type transcriptional repressor AseR [Candidatus Lithacetigena glycinireducens]
MSELAIILKTIADETRFQILNLLLTKDFCVGALAKQLGLSEAAVSQHLQILRKAGIVTGEKRGYYTHYGVNREILKKTGEKMIELSSQNHQCHNNCPKSSLEEHKS